MSSPISLDHYLIDRLVFSANLPHKLDDSREDEVEIEPKVTKRVLTRDDREQMVVYVVVLNVKLNTSKEAKITRRYSAEIRLYGYYSNVGGLNEEKFLSFISQAGPRHLYGIARGILGQLTGIAPYGFYNLPVIDLREKTKPKPIKKTTTRKPKSVKKPKAAKKTK